MHVQSHQELSVFLYFISCLLIIISWIAISLYNKETETFDHSTIVIDELIGQTLTLAATHYWLFYINDSLGKWNSLSPLNFSFLAAFFAFRYFDIAKPLFIKKLDGWHKYSIFVILDDIAAAALSASSIYCVYFIIIKIQTLR
jgi:phosphatidylglycerophosphatase A